MKQYLEIIKVALISSLIAANISFWLFYGDWTFLPVPLITGFLLAVIQNEDRVYKFLGKLTAGSIFFGFLSALFMHTEMYLISNIVYKSGLPFWPLYNPGEYLMFSLVFSFICFMGGLAGIVIKGFFVISRNKVVQRVTN